MLPTALCVIRNRLLILSHVHFTGGKLIQPLPSRTKLPSKLDFALIRGAYLLQRPDTSARTRERRDEDPAGWLRRDPPSCQMANDGQFVASSTRIDAFHEPRRVLKFVRKLHTAGDDAFHSTSCALITSRVESVQRWRVNILPSPPKGFAIGESQATLVRRRGPK